MLRDYQARDIAELRPLVGAHRSVLHQLPTGAGKTAEIAEIVSLIRAVNPGFVVWFVVPRNELLQQASEHFARWGIAHGHIKAGREESRAFKVQIVSKDTLLRRLARIKQWPDVLIFDEAHLYYDAQLLIIEWARQAKPALKVIGITATPERLDGRGLSTTAGGPYEAIHIGPSIPWLTDRGFLSHLRYFAPPIEGLESIHRRGVEYDAGELDALLEKRKVYGDVIRYYEKYGTVARIGSGVSISGQPIHHINSAYHKGRPALIFCRSVKSAYETAERFTQAGYLFFCIEGKMAHGERARLIEALRKGEIDGLTNCDLATYGLDIPRVEYGASIRPTLSRALYFQMVGRILRPFDSKEEALFFDHANLVEEHSEPSISGVPLFYVDGLTWNFDGRERREREPAATSAMRLCPFKDYQYCADPACAGGCKMLPKESRELETVDVPLQEITPRARWSELAPGERRDVQERVGRAADAWMAAQAEDPPRIDAGAVGELLAVAKELGRQPIWVFWYLTEKEENSTGKKRMAVNVTLLHEIARQKEYRIGWVWYQKNRIEETLKEKAEMFKAKEKAETAVF